MLKRRRRERKGIEFWLLVLIIGALIGSIVAEIIGLFYTNADSFLHKLFVAGLQLGFQPKTFHLYILDFTVGLHIKLTVTTLIGLMVAVYLGKFL